ncbi:hypothetical protein M2347_001959 [Chryseobacterium sp. H1D6B]|uniref:hypothetical protein n=1 Tax=Chryseobacterium sp. H1D6B TaxID=2940588 RepID=UPI0015CBC577|nr:hypothetical protein [Chryseobacterium sp. H1D6B]MDH6252232.1 hypothetical protein [Chryseobacterium sp. H1D6B]
MKRLSIFICIFCLTIVFGQKVSDFKYVSIPEKFKTFNDNFGLENFLTKALKGKKYIILEGDKIKWPAEVVDNYCNVMNADVINNKSLLKNKIILQFKDCNGKVLFESKGTSTIKEFQEGFQDALQQALITVPISNPTEISIQSENKSQEERTSKTDSSSNRENVNTRYTNGKLTLQKIKIDADQFILVDSNGSAPFATFKTTTKKDVFRVKLENGNSTIGYFENGNIVIEIPQPNGEYSKEVFSGK